MKKQIALILGLILISFVIFLPIVSAEEDSTNQLLSEYAELYGDVFQDGLENIESADEFFELIPDFDPEEIISGLNSGEINVSPGEIAKFIIRIFAEEIYVGIKLLGVVLALSILSSYLGGLKSGFGGEAVANSGFYVCFVVIAGIAATAFYDAAGSAVRVTESIGFFMRVIVPVMITLLMTSGAIISATALEPTLLSIVEIGVWVIENIFVPLVMISTALNIVNGMSDKFKTEKMVKFMNNTVRWGLTVMMTIFVSLAGLKSIASSGVDGLTIKLSKFVTANLVPMVGGILAESVETVMNCSVVIKNSVGIFGIICLGLIAIRPALKLGAMLLLFRITAAIAEPVSDEKVVGCLSKIGDSVSVLFSMIVAVVVMFVMVVTIVLNAGNTAIILGG